jgi:hypothetical protein
MMVTFSHSGFSPLIMRLAPVFWLGGAISFSSGAMARVARTECLDFEGDRPLAGEALNDAASYAWTRDWDDRWDVGGNGARMSAGSLNAYKFLYLEQIRFEATPRDSALWLFLQREKRETANEYELSNELDLTFPFDRENNLAASLITDSDSDKKWSDMGLAIGRRKNLVDYAEIFFWSVDHYYNTKELEDARWITKPYSWGLRFSRPENGLALRKLLIEIDTPSRLRRGSNFCDYAKLALSATGDIGDEWRWGIQHQSKEKSISYEGADVARIDADRAYNRLDLTWSRIAADRSRWTAGIELHSDILRRSDITVANTREEAVLRADRASDIGNNFRGTLGAVASRGERTVDRGEPGEKETIEQVKFQTGLEYRVGDRGAFRTLANWDLDHLVTDFPFKKHQLRPWDGGLLQFSLYQ